MDDEEGSSLKIELIRGFGLRLSIRDAPKGDGGLWRVASSNIWLGA